MYIVRCMESIVGCIESVEWNTGNLHSRVHGKCSRDSSKVHAEFSRLNGEWVGLQMATKLGGAEGTKN